VKGHFFDASTRHRVAQRDSARRLCTRKATTSATHDQRRRDDATRHVLWHATALTVATHFPTSTDIKFTMGGFRQC
jgi:hypothetical protein